MKLVDVETTVRARDDCSCTFISNTTSGAPEISAVAPALSFIQSWPMEQLSVTSRAVRGYSCGGQCPLGGQKRQRNSTV